MCALAGILCLDARLAQFFTYCNRLLESQLTELLFTHTQTLDNVRIILGILTRSFDYQ